MGYFSMPKYFQNMPTVGKALVNPNAENETEIKEIEKQIHDKVTEILAAGIRHSESNQCSHKRGTSFLLPW